MISRITTKRNTTSSNKRNVTKTIIVRHGASNCEIISEGTVFQKLDMLANFMLAISQAHNMSIEEVCSSARTLAIIAEINEKALLAGKPGLYD